MTAQVRNFLTVDIEEWFHVCGVGGVLAPDRWPTLPSRVEFTTDLTLDLLARHGVTATFFVLGWIADRHPRLVERILQAGHEVASHGWTHRRVFELDEESFAEELTRTNATLEDAGAPRPAGFRAQEWSINDRAPWALAVLARTVSVMIRACLRGASWVTRATRRCPIAARPRMGRWSRCPR